MSTAIKTRLWDQQFAAICESLRDHFENIGDKAPMLLFEDDHGLSAYRIQQSNGHVHRVHRDLEWASEAAFIGSNEEHHPDAVTNAIRRELEI